MIVINHTVKTVFFELIKALKVCTKVRERTYNHGERIIRWQHLQDIYLTIDNLVLEMATGIDFTAKPSLRVIQKAYQKASLPDELVYTNNTFEVNKKREVAKKKRALLFKNDKPKQGEMKKRGRPKKK